MSLRVKQASTYVGKQRWRWSVWIEGSARELDQVEYVEYTLHSTFLDPVRRVDDRSSKFRLDSVGWGEFLIILDIKKKSGRVSRRTHRLTLDDRSEPPRKEPIRKTVMISSAIADAPLASALTEALSAVGVDVVTPNDVRVEQPVEAAFNSLLESTDAAVIVVSDRESPWLKRELQAFEDMGIPLSAVVVGSEGTIPEQLQHIPSLRLKNEADARDVALQISDQLTNVES